MAGIAQQPDTGGSQIITDEGDDKVIGTADNDGEGLTAGILGDLEIVTGSGNDEVIASAQLSGTRVDGFAADPITGEAVTVDTGSGNDLVKGFGQGHFNGGRRDEIFTISLNITRVSLRSKSERVEIMRLILLIAIFSVRVLLLLKDLKFFSLLMVSFLFLIWHNQAIEFELISYVLLVVN